MENKKVKLKYGVVNNIIFLLKDMRRVYPLLFVYMLIQASLSVISPLFGIYLPKITVDLVTGQADTGQVLLILGGFGLVMALSMALSSMASNGKYIMYNDMRMYYRERLFIKSLYCEYIHVESPEGQTKYQRAVNSVNGGDWSGCSKMTVSMLDIFVSLLCFIIYSGIITSLNVFIMFFLVSLSVINLLAVKRVQKYEHSLRDEQSKINKKMNYIEWTAKDTRYGKDIRLYGMSGMFEKMNNQLLGSYIELIKKIKNRYFFSGAVDAFTLLLRDGIAYGYLIWLVSSGDITIGNFVLYFGAITGFSGFVSGIINNMNELNGANLQMNDLRAYLDITGSPETEKDKDMKDIDITKKENVSIEFRDVYFSYDRNSSPILDGFNLMIKSGEKIALVGVNGVGKTTVVKLLCGFYKPDKGQILINGINIDEYERKDLYGMISAIFQDIYISPFTVIENVSLQTRDKTDEERIVKCLKKAGLYDEIIKYPDGLHSLMTREISDGIVLSGGQQQKLLMARALYKDAPLLILDEPTAALDPIAESQTYQSFHDISASRTAIYISHRLASTRFCDRVVFLSGGIVAESGTHEELIEYGGEYARMFELQSHYYRQ